MKFVEIQEQAREEGIDVARKWFTRQFPLRNGASRGSVSSFSWSVKRFHGFSTNAWYIFISSATQADSVMSFTEKP